MNNIQFANTRKLLKSEPRKFKISGNSKQFVRTMDNSKHRMWRKTIYLAIVTSNNNSERKQKVKALYCKSRSRYPHSPHPKPDTLQHFSILFG